MAKRGSTAALLSTTIALLLLAMSANAAPRPAGRPRPPENPSHAKGMPLFYRSQAGTTWIDVNGACSASDTLGSTHSPAQVWCFEGVGGDSSWPGQPGNPWRSWSKFDPPVPKPGKWFLSSQYTQTGAGVLAWLGCDALGVNTACEETVFWANPANVEGYGDDWNYSLILNIDGADHAAGGTIAFDIRYDVECNYDYLYLEYLSGFSVVGIDTLYEWTTLATYNGVSGVEGLEVCGGDELGFSDRDSSGVIQHGNAAWRPEQSVPLPLTGGTSPTNTRLRWRGKTDSAWSDADDQGDTQGIAMLDNVSVTFASGGSVSSDFGVTEGMTFPAPIGVGGASAEWVVSSLEGNPYNAWRVAFDPDYKNKGNTCDYSDDWMFTTRIPILNQYTNEAGWDYFLVSPQIPCAGWTGGVMEYTNYRCFPPGSSTTGDRNDYGQTVIRVHDTSGAWSHWNDFYGFDFFFEGCSWHMNEIEDLSTFLGPNIDSLQIGFEMLDLSQPGDYTWGKHKNTSWQIDHVSFGSFDGSATIFRTSEIRLFADTFSLVDPAHTAQLGNEEQGQWSGQPGGTRDFEEDDSLTVDVNDPDGMTSGPVSLHWRIGTGTPPAFGSWSAKPMVLQQQDILGSPGEGRYATTIGNTTTEDFHPTAEGTPDFIWEPGTTVQYYFTAVDDAADTAYFPTRADVDSTAVFRFQVLPMGRILSDVDSSRILIVDDYGRVDLDFENSTGFVPNGGAGYGGFTIPAYDQPENMVERALVLLAGGDEDGTTPPLDGGPKWDIYNVFGPGSSVQCEPRVRADATAGLGGIVSASGEPLYDAVIWLQGTFDNYSYSDSSAAQLPSYLVGGGHFLGFGSEVVEWATGAGETTLVSTLFQDYLGTQYAGEQVEWRICNFTGEDGTSLEGLKFGLYGECNGSRKTYDKLALSTLDPATNTVLAQYTDSNNPGVPVSGVAIIKNVVNSVGVGIQTGFDVGSMLSDDSRACFLGQLLTNEFGIAGLDDTVCPLVNPSVPLTDALSGFALAEAAPNPFPDATAIRFSIARRTHVSIGIYNVLGRKVRTLVDGMRDADVYRETWDGRADDGTPVTSGVYFTKMTAGEFSATRKVVRLK